MSNKDCALRGLSARRAQAVEIGHSDEYLEGFDAAVRALENMPDGNTPSDSASFHVKLDYPGAEIAVLRFLDPNDPENFEQVHTRALERAKDESLMEPDAVERTFVLPREIGAKEMLELSNVAVPVLAAIREVYKKYDLLRAIVEEEYARARENG